MKNASKNTANVRSPLSRSPPIKIRDLPKAFILEQLEIYYGQKPPPHSVEHDYSIWECAETGLQFAWPMLPGNKVFYEWLAGFDSYYPGIRWEYGKVQRILQTENIAGWKDSRILDVGCGKGDFLRSLALMPNENKSALDLNEPAVAECRSRGFNSFCGTIETAAASGFLRQAESLVVTSFHCLEHVEKPVEFVRMLVSAALPGGRVFISTPYSPMSFEFDWFDILNHPPHHMTRWNLLAYQRLAGILGLKMRYFVPRSGALRRALSAFRLVKYGPHRSVGKVRLLKDLLLHFSEFARHHRKQTQRKPIAADLILVEFTVP